MSSTTRGSAPTSGLAITSLVLGILTLLAFWMPFLHLFPGLLAVLLGILGLRQVRRGTAGGKGLAIAGILCAVLGMVPTVLLVGGIVVALISGTPTPPPGGTPTPPPVVAPHGSTMPTKDEAVTDNDRGIATEVETTPDEGKPTTRPDEERGAETSETNPPETGSS